MRLEEKTGRSLGEVLEKGMKRDYCFKHGKFNGSMDMIQDGVGDLYASGQKRLKARVLHVKPR